ncbi:MAG: V-type ATPase 116kDa subunit family protein [Longimicrobiales bacterium]|nr:V-type ATPase 116kDa subunit family protein [Longimicrobiales bacterium]
MIVPMARVRILGPRELLPATLPVLQDFGRLHVVEPRTGPELRPLQQSASTRKHEDQLRRARTEVSRALEALGISHGAGDRAASRELSRETVAAWLRTAREVARRAEALNERRSALAEEQALLRRYRPLLPTFEAMSESVTEWHDVAAYFVLVPEAERRSLARLRDSLRETVGDAFEIWSRRIPSGEQGVLIVVSEETAEELDRLIHAAGLQEIELPGGAEGLSPMESIRRIGRRLEELPDELGALDAELADLRSSHASLLRTAEAALADELARMDVTTHAGETRHAFVLEGWVPEDQVVPLRDELTTRVGETTVVEELEREEWVGEDAPVVLHNPRLFRPFERLVTILPLPRYGTVDPTPFLAIFFPMFFGIVLGDMGYGLLLGAAALLLRRGSDEESTRRAVAEIAGACAAFTIIFGALYGELLGDLGARRLGLEAVWLHREEALLPFLGLALAIGVVHTILGLVLNVISKLREGGREAIGPGVTLAMVTLVVLALLAAVDVIPRTFFTPAVVTVLVLFPVLVVLEGILGPTELLSTLGHILSYARVMAVGTASVMMAVAANRMVGAFGSVVVGALFALLFHLVNFALGVFSPTVHALRLHFVEFFGTFYSPGGHRYEPFGHWSPPDPQRKEKR